MELGILGGKQVIGDFNGGDIVTDSGEMLLAEADHELGLTEKLAVCVSDGPDETTDLTGDYPGIERRLAAKMTDMRKLSDRYRAERDVDGEHYTTEERRKIEDHLRSYGYL